MAAHRARRFADVDQLKAMSQRQLKALLAPYVEYLDHRGLGVEGADIDLEKLSGILMNPDENMPARLVEALYLINEMATPEGMDALRTAVAEAGYELIVDDSMTPADVAVEVRLRWPDVLDRKHAESLVTRPRSFHYYLGTSRSPIDLPAMDVVRDVELQRKLDDWFYDAQRGRGCRVLRVERQQNLWFLIRHGLPLKREGSLKNGVSDTVFYRPEKHDVVVFDANRNELGINTRSKNERELYRTSFGQHLFENSAHFASEKKYSLDPLKRLGPNSLVCSDIEGIERIQLIELMIFHGGCESDIEIRRASDVLAVLRRRKRNLAPWTRLIRAVFSVEFTGAAVPRNFTIIPTGKAQYTRDDDSDLVELWMLKRGFIVPASPWQRSRPARRTWTAMAHMQNLSDVIAGWHDHVGDEIHALGQLLRPTDRLADRLPCQNPGNEGCPRRVVKHADGTTIAACGARPAHCDSIKVSETDLIVHELDQRTMCDMLASLLDLDEAFQVLTCCPQTWQIGDYAPLRAERYPVYLTISDCPDDISTRAVRLSGLADRPFLLVVPNREYVSEDTTLFLASRKSRLLALSELVAIKGRDQWVPLPHAKDLFDDFRKSVLGLPRKKGPTARFPTPSGSTWADLTLRFVTGHQIHVQIDTESEVYEFSQMGMADSRKKPIQPNKQWELLVSFAENNSIVRWQTTEENRTLQKQKEALAKFLKQIFRIDGDPFDSTEDQGGWRARFKVIPEP